MTFRTYSRYLVQLLAVGLVAAGIAFAFWPRAALVDMAEVTRGDMSLTIEERGKTRVAEAFIVSTPVAGRLLRVEVHPGDIVQKGVTVVARMRPADPAALDARTREQGLAAVEAAEAALHLAEAAHSAARADMELAKSDLGRTEILAGTGTVSPVALDRARTAFLAAEARLHTAQAAIAQREAELQSAEAQLIEFSATLQTPPSELAPDIPILAPSDGTILRVMSEDEATLPAGTPILEIGDIAGGLEVVADLISSDAVKVRPGSQVTLSNWGANGLLQGRVTRVSPNGETQISALGVEEQRVSVVIALTSRLDERPSLGHGYALDVSIEVLRLEDAVLIPSSALFRSGGSWSAYVVIDGRAERRELEIGADNGHLAQVVSGLEPGDVVVVYPSADLEEGDKVQRRVVDA